MSAPQPPPISLTGCVFGRLTVVMEAGATPSNIPTQSLWHCRCACGSMRVFSANELCALAVRSCGCVQNGTCNSLNQAERNAAIYAESDRSTNADIARKYGLTRQRVWDIVRRERARRTREV